MRKSSWVSAVALIAIIASGCTKQPNKETITLNQPVRKQQESFESNLEDILQKRGSFIEVTGAKEHYKQGENISFVVDTKGQVGYLYIMSVDSSKVTFLQPNPVSPLSEMRGRRSFPEDFTNGAFNIQAIKNCQSCQKEETTVYALLTKKPIANIEKKITGETLLSFYKNSRQAKRVTRGIHLNIANSNSSSNLSIGKMDFIVE